MHQVLSVNNTANPKGNGDTMQLVGSEVLPQVFHIQAILWIIIATVKIALVPIILEMALFRIEEN